MRKAASIKLTDDERHSLTKLANGRRTEVRVAMRAKVVLAAARGQENRAIAKDWTRPPFKGKRPAATHAPDGICTST